jgi:ABC-type transport system involved in multi-copper enzyme maturation permease subunit
MNIIFLKDLVELLRLRRVAAIQISFVIVLAFLTLATWPQGSVLAVAAQGRDSLLFGLVIGQLALLTLFVPSMAATAICRERELNTFEMLYASSLSPSRIVIGKTLSAVSFPFLLIIDGLPFLALLVWRGDVDFRQLLLSYSVLVVAALMLALICLAVSAFSHQTATAIIVSYILVLTLFGGLLVPASLLLHESSGPLANILHYARSLSPVAAALSLLRPDFGDALFGGRDQDGLLPIWQVFLPLATLTIVGCFCALVAHLQKPPAEKQQKFDRILAAQDRSLVRKMVFLIDDRKQRQPLGSLNPIAGKERRTHGIRSGRWMIRTFYASLVLALALAVMGLYGGIEHADLLAHVATILVVLQLSLVAIIDPILTSSTISNEVEIGTFEMLRLTPLKTSTLFWGKLLPALPSALLPVVALLPAYGAVAYVDPGYLSRFLLLLPVVLLSALFCCLVGLTASSFFDRTTRATVAAYLCCVAIFVLPVFPYLASGAQISPTLAAWLGLSSPLVIALNLMPGGLPDVRTIWLVHIIVIGVLCIFLLLVSRYRLTVLMRRGV